MRRLFSLTALLAAFCLASVASTARAAAPIDHFRDTIDETFPDTQCGIDGTSTFIGIDNIQVWDDKFKVEAHDEDKKVGDGTHRRAVIAIQPKK